MKHCNKFHWLIGIISVAAVVAAVVSAAVVYLEKKKKDEEDLEHYLDCSIQQFKKRCEQVSAYSLLFYPLSDGFEHTAAIYPKNTAALIPAAAAVTPPVKAPSNPKLSTASIVPFARV